jgi:hypothetical protein
VHRSAKRMGRLVTSGALALPMRRKSTVVVIPDPRLSPRCVERRARSLADHAEWRLITGAGQTPTKLRHASAGAPRHRSDGINSLAA